MQDKLNSIKALITECEADADRFYKKGNKAAGRRVRRNMQLVKNLAHELRMDILKKSK